jgi:hypothetical protein
MGRPAQRTPWKAFTHRKHAHETSRYAKALLPLTVLGNVGITNDLGCKGLGILLASTPSDLYSIAFRETGPMSSTLSDSLRPRQKGQMMKGMPSSHESQ